MSEGERKRKAESSKDDERKRTERKAESSKDDERKRKAESSKDDERKRKAEGSKDSGDKAAPPPAKKKLTEAEEKKAAAMAAAAKARKKRDDMWPRWKQQLTEVLASGGGWGKARPIFDKALALIASKDAEAPNPHLPYQLYTELVVLADDDDIHRATAWMERAEVAALFSTAKLKTPFLLELFHAIKSLSAHALADPEPAGRAKRLLSRLMPLPAELATNRRTGNPATNRALHFLAAEHGKSVAQMEEAYAPHPLPRLLADLRDKYGVDAAPADALLRHLRCVAAPPRGSTHDVLAQDGGRRELLAAAKAVLEALKAARGEKAKPVAAAVATGDGDGAPPPAAGGPAALPRGPGRALCAPLLLHDPASRVRVLYHLSAQLGGACSAMLGAHNSDAGKVPKTAATEACALLADVWRELERERPGGAAGAMAGARAEFYSEAAWSQWKRGLGGSARPFDGADAAVDHAAKPAVKAVGAAKYPPRSKRNAAELPKKPRRDVPAGADGAYPLGLGVLDKEKEKPAPKGGFDASDALGWGCWWGRTAQPDDAWLADPLAAPPADDVPKWLSGADGGGDAARRGAGSLALWHRARELIATDLVDVHRSDDVGRKGVPILDPTVVARVDRDGDAAA